MALNIKSTKSELIAIYRLEFYKNKKNWKLSQDVKKEPPRSPPPKTKSTHLNETYDVEADIDAEQVSLHNKAFLDEEPEDAPDIKAPPDSELAALLTADHQLCPQHSWMDQSWTGDKPETVWQTAQQEWCGAEAEGVPEHLVYTDQCDGPCRHHQHAWTPANQYDQIKPQCSSTEQLKHFSPIEVLQSAEEWLQNHGHPVCEECPSYYEQYEMMDDSMEFVRGAHRAPHSSETDLSLAHDECECMTSDALCVLSARQLSSAVRRHATALRHLLLEHALRDKLITQSTLSPPLPYEDYPTRDTDPLRPPDIVLSGSHQLPDAGRGRGRLRQSDRVIGIGMGRPYRL